MKRLPWLVWITPRHMLMTLALLTLAGGLLAFPVSEVRQAVFTQGGGIVEASVHSLNVVIGQSVVGRSVSANHALQHGAWPPQFSTVTDVSDDIGFDGGTSTLPKVAQLHGNVPNPFNPRTRVDYDVPASGSPVWRLPLAYPRVMQATQRPSWRL